jgi:hypothetical protein
MLQAPGHLNDGQAIPYGFALTLGQLHGVKTVSHYGAYGGYRSTLLRFPDKDLSVITLCNTAAAPSTLAEHVGEVLLGLIPQRQNATTLDLSTRSWAVGTSVPTDPTDTRRRSDQLAQLAGAYYSDELDLSVNLTVRDGVIVMQRQRGGDLRFVSVGDDLFTNSDQMLLHVLRDDGGAVSGFTLTISRVRGLQFVRRSGDAARAP